MDVKYLWEWLDEEICILGKSCWPGYQIFWSNKYGILSEMGPYGSELILRLDGTLWLAIISKPPLDPPKGYYNPIWAYFGMFVTENVSTIWTVRLYRTFATLYQNLLKKFKASPGFIRTLLDLTRSYQPEPQPQLCAAVVVSVRRFVALVAAVASFFWWGTLLHWDWLCKRWV